MRPNSVGQLRQALDRDWPPEIYRSEVLSSGIRRFQFNRTPRSRAIHIVQNLLGIELTLGHQRISVPDLGTARYLAVFARLGVRNVAIPYDITRIPKIADRLEGAYQRLLLQIDYLTRSASPRSAQSLRQRAFRQLRADFRALESADGHPQSGRVQRSRS